MTHYEQRASSRTQNNKNKINNIINEQKKASKHDKIR